MATAQASKGFDQLGRNLDRVQCPGIRLNCGARPIRGKIEFGWNVDQLFLPIFQVLLERFMLRLPLLPSGIIGILQWQRREGRRPTLRKRLIERANSRRNTPIDQPSETI